MMLRSQRKLEGMFVKIFALVSLVVATCMLEVHATEEVSVNSQCRGLKRNINFEDSEPGPYKDDDLQSDFDGYRYFKRRDMASIKQIDGSKYLDVKLHDGCVGTVGKKGCGLLGGLPLFGMGDSATLEYTVQFGDNFNFRLGGKLMGLCSGACKSGCQRSASDGFSARIMWGPNGSLYLYTYTFSGSTRTCGMNTKPDTAVQLKPGQDYTIRLALRMNAPDSDDGVVSMYVDGKHIVTADGLKMRTSADQVVDQMVFHTFFGGSGEPWAAQKDEHILFKSIKIWDGDCGGGDGSLEIVQEAAWEPEPRGMPEDARELSLTTNIYGSWNGRFCLWYEITNDGSDDCESFVLETNVNPSYGAMASYKNLKMIESDEEKGFFMFKREKPEDAFMKPGKTRDGNVCMEAEREVKQSNARLEANFKFNAYCKN